MEVGVRIPQVSPLGRVPPHAVEVVVHVPIPQTCRKSWKCHIPRALLSRYTRWSSTASSSALDAILSKIVSCEINSK